MSMPKAKKDSKYRGVKRVLGFKPEYYSRNKYECIHAKRNENGTVNLLMKSNYWDIKYCVWIGCHAESGKTEYGKLTRRFSAKRDALEYMRKFK